MIFFRVLLITLLTETISLSGMQDSTCKIHLLEPLVRKVIPEIPDYNEAGKHKCGFTLVAEAKLNAGSFSPEGRALLKNVLSRPALSKSVVSPSGFFRIHYDSAGSNAVKYSIAEFALALDSALSFQVDKMGFQPPVRDNGEGGDDKYDVYITDIGGYYGYTEPEFEIVAGSKRHYSFMVIDNDFQGFYTTGLNAARVTAAHELNHAIQISRYILKTNNFGYLERYFYEMTSTAMEEFVFDYVNDYYVYLDEFFDSPERPIQYHSGYDLPHWVMYIQNKYGYGIIRRMWELFRERNGLDAMEAALTEAGSSFGVDYTDFAAWCYFTGYRYIPGSYFEEGEKYPTLKPFSYTTLNGSSAALNLSLRPAAIYYLRVVNRQSGTSDTLFSLVINANIGRAIDSPDVYMEFVYMLYTYSVSGTVPVAGKYYIRLSGSNAVHLNLANILNGYYVPNTGGSFMPLGYSYPSPYEYRRHYPKPLIIPAPGNEVENDVDFSVIDLSGDIIFSGKQRVFFDGSKKIRWLPLDKNGNKLPTGIYVYIVKGSQKSLDGKIVILN